MRAPRSHAARLLGARLRECRLLSLPPTFQLSLRRRAGGFITSGTITGLGTHPLLYLGKRCTELGAIGQMRHLFRLQAHERSTSQPGVLSSLFDSDDECVLLGNPVSAVCNALLGTCQRALEGYLIHLMPFLKYGASTRSHHRGSLGIRSGEITWPCGDASTWHRWFKRTDVGGPPCGFGVTPHRHSLSSLRVRATGRSQPALGKPPGGCRGSPGWRRVH